MRDVNADGSETDPDRDLWMDGFESGYSGGLVCETCGAMVHQSPVYASKHRQWHLTHDR